MNEVDTEDEDDENEDEEGTGERKREARVFHGSLTMKDLQPATRWEPLYFFTFTFPSNNFETCVLQVQGESGEQKCLWVQQSRRGFRLCH